MRSLLESLGVLEKTTPPPTAPQPTVEVSVALSSVRQSPYADAAEGALGTVDAACAPSLDLASVGSQIHARIHDMLSHVEAPTEALTVSQFWDKYVKISKGIKNPRDAVTATLAVSDLTPEALADSLAATTEFLTKDIVSKMVVEFHSPRVRDMEECSHRAETLSAQIQALEQQVEELKASLQQEMGTISQSKVDLSAIENLIDVQIESVVKDLRFFTNIVTPPTTPSK